MSGQLVFDIRCGRPVGWLLGVLGRGRRWSRVVVDGDSVDVRTGWGFRTTLPFDRIVGARPAERTFIGWGVHGWRGRWLVNGSLQGVVEIDIEPPVRGWTAFVPLRLRTVFVSLADPTGFLTAVDRVSADGSRGR